MDCALEVSDNILEAERDTIHTWLRKFNWERNPELMRSFDDPDTAPRPLRVLGRAADGSVVDDVAVVEFLAARHKV